MSTKSGQVHRFLGTVRTIHELHETHELTRNVLNSVEPSEGVSTLSQRRGESRFVVNVKTF